MPALSFGTLSSPSLSVCLEEGSMEGSFTLLSRPRVQTEKKAQQALNDQRELWGNMVNC